MFFIFAFCLLSNSLTVVLYTNASFMVVFYFAFSEMFVAPPPDVFKQAEERNVPILDHLLGEDHMDMSGELKFILQRDSANLARFRHSPAARTTMFR